MKSSSTTPRVFTKPNLWLLLQLLCTCRDVPCIIKLTASSMLSVFPTDVLDMQSVSIVTSYSGFYQTIELGIVHSQVMLHLGGLIDLAR